MSEMTPQMMRWATDTLLALAEANPAFTLVDFERKLRTYLVAWRKHQSEMKDRCIKNAEKIANLSSLCRTTKSAILVDVFKQTKIAYLEYQVKLETALRKGDTQMRFYETLHAFVLQEIRDANEAVERELDLMEIADGT